MRMMKMATECEHTELSVIWGDGGAYYARENEIHRDEETGEYKKFITGEWKCKDGSWGEDSDRWLIGISCERCDKVLMSESINADELSKDEKELIKMLREMGA